MSDPEEKIDVTDLKDTFLECPVCIEHFNQTDRRPRLLNSCLHAFCTQCLDQLLEKEGKGQVTCPICRQVERVRRKADSLPPDPMRSKLVDYVQLKRRKRILCSECEEHEAISRCQECQCYLCKDCDYVHRRHRVSRDHLIQTLDKVMKEPVKNLSKGHFCPSHPKHHIKSYCSTEGKLCCVSCTVLDHRGHNLQKLEEAAEEKKGEMIMKMTEVRQLTQVLEKARKKGIQQEKAISDIKDKSLSDIKSILMSYAEQLMKENVKCYHPSMIKATACSLMSKRRCLLMNRLLPSLSQLTRTSHRPKRREMMWKCCRCILP